MLSVRCQALGRMAYKQVSPFACCLDAIRQPLLALVVGELHELFVFRIITSGSPDSRPVGFQSQMFWALVFLMQILKKKKKSRCPMQGSNPLHLKESPGFGFSLCCGWCQPGMWFTAGLCSSLSYPDLMWFVFCLSNVALSFSQPSGFVFLGGNCCFCSCRLTCPWGQVSSGSNQVAVLNSMAVYLDICLLCHDFSPHIYTLLSGMFIRLGTSMLFLQLSS